MSAEGVEVAWLRGDEKGAEAWLGEDTGSQTQLTQVSTQLAFQVPTGLIDGPHLTEIMSLHRLTSRLGLNICVCIAPSYPSYRHNHSTLENRQSTPYR